MIIILSHYFWSLNKWEAHMQIYAHMQMFFSNTHWPQLTAPFYSILFETFICQFNSSKFSPITPDEVREHLTRDQRPFLHDH